MQSPPPLKKDNEAVPFNSKMNMYNSCRNEHNLYLCNLAQKMLRNRWLHVFYTSLTNFYISTKYLMICKVYDYVDGINKLYHVCTPVRKIIHSLKLVDYLHVQADNPWYKYYLHFLIVYQPNRIIIYSYSIF